MRKVILTIEIEEAEAVKQLIDSLPIMIPTPDRVKRVLSFNAKLHQAINRTKGNGNGKSER